MKFKVISTVILFIVLAVAYIVYGSQDSTTTPTQSGDGLSINP